MGTYDVFISYRRSDVAVARALHALLSLFGKRVFLDVSCIPLGVRWEPTIRDALQSASTILVLWSRNAANSDYMCKEWQWRRAGARLIPIRLDDSALPNELAPEQAVDLKGSLGFAARITELTIVQKMKREDAVKAAAQGLLAEVGETDFELTQAREEAAIAYAGAVEEHASGGWGVAGAVIGWLLARSIGAVMSSPSAALAILVFAFGAGTTVARQTPPRSEPVATCAEIRACTPAPPEAEPLSVDGLAKGRELEKLVRTVNDYKRALDQQLAGLGRCPPIIRPPTTAGALNPTVFSSTRALTAEASPETSDGTALR